MMKRALLLVLLVTSCARWEPLGVIPGSSRRIITGSPANAESFAYQLRVPAGSRIASHRHTTDMHVKVLRGSMFITMSGTTHHFTTGNSFTIPANTWHAEWWDQDSTMEASGVGPMKTDFETP